MIKYLLIFGTIFNLNAQQWLESDKQLHLIGGAGFGALGYTVGYEVSKGKRSTAIWYGIGSATAVGTFKELWDIPSTGFDRDDLFTTIIGGVISTFATDLIMSRHTYQERKEMRLEAIKRRDKWRKLHEIEKMEKRKQL
jgi:hypothetical protein